MAQQILICCCILTCLGSVAPQTYVHVAGHGYFRKVDTGSYYPPPGQSGIIYHPQYPPPQPKETISISYPPPAHFQQAQPVHQQHIQHVYQPQIQPVHQPQIQPVHQPQIQPVHQPQIQPVHQPQIQPVHQPQIQPVHQPQIQPVHQPQVQPFYGPKPPSLLENESPISSPPTPYPPIDPLAIAPHIIKHPGWLQYVEPNLQIEALPELRIPISPRCNAVNGITRFCQERSSCFHSYPLYSIVDQYSTCILPFGDIGVCCPAEDFTWAISSYTLNDDYYEGVFVRDTRSSSVYKDALYKAEEEILDFEKTLQKIEVRFTSTPDKLHQDMLRTTPAAFIAARHGLILSLASQLLNDSRGTDLKFVSLAQTQLKSFCREVPVCSLSPYRNIDGSCNNLLNPLWGSTNSGLQRMGKPDYGDGIASPRLAKNGQELPSGRYMSLNYVKDVGKPHPTITHLAMSFGQLIAHDLSKVAVFTKPGDKTISCCTEEVLADPSLQHPACYPIKLEKDDPRYEGHPCMEFVRAVPAQPDDCKLSNRRDPMSQVTHALDCSFVYGSDKETLDKIRLNRDGLLITTTIHGEEMLPHRNSSKCGNPKNGIYCFDSGDNRVNQQPPILSLHVILHREHNRLAEELTRINPHWNDEKLFQEARKILIAQIQHITFNEFLPLMLDYQTRMNHGLLLKSAGYSYNYDPRLKPNVFCAFQAAAFRIGHSLVQNHMGLFKNGHLRGGVSLKENYFNPNLFYNKESNLDYILKGLLLEPSQSPDGYFAKALTLDLFKKGSHPGLDLYAINVQRGRDVGINGYNEWRSRCGLSKATKFSHFNDVMDAHHVRTLEEIYNHVDDVDLYTAGVMETPIYGLIVGPTFSCIIAKQFQRFRLADRFWYERYSADENVGFTQDQLAQIRRSTLARMLCLNSKMRTMQPLALLLNTNTYVIKGQVHRMYFHQILKQTITIS